MIILLTAILTTLYKGVTYLSMKGEKGDKIIFLEILGTVESSLCQRSALIRYSLPVRLTHHKADSALSIRFLLLFQISPSNLDKTTLCYDQGVSVI